MHTHPPARPRPLPSLCGYFVFGCGYLGVALLISSLVCFIPPTPGPHPRAPCTPSALPPGSELTRCPRPPPPLLLLLLLPPRGDIGCCASGAGGGSCQCNITHTQKNVNIYLTAWKQKIKREHQTKIRERRDIERCGRERGELQGLRLREDLRSVLAGDPGVLRGALPRRARGPRGGQPREHPGIHGERLGWRRVPRRALPFPQVKKSE